MYDSVDCQKLFTNMKILKPNTLLLEFLSILAMNNSIDWTIENYINPKWRKFLIIYDFNWILAK